MKDKLVSLSQKFSQASIQIVMFLAIMGMGLAIGVIMQLKFMPSFVIFIGMLLNTIMNAMLNNLSIIFCVGLATAFAKTKKVDAAIISLVTFIMFLAGNNAWLTSQHMLTHPGTMGLYGTGQNMVLGFQVVDMNVFLGIILGCITGYVFNKVSKIQFIEVFRVYGGSRFAFIVMIPVILCLSIGLSYVWPVVNYGISCLSGFMKSAGALGVFVYAFGNRFLIPTGLHHLLWMPFGFTGIGGSMKVGGKAVQGAVNIFYSEMGNTAKLTAIDPSIRFATFGFAKIFGSLGVVLAMIKTAKPENKNTVKGLLIPALFVSMVAGITEPLDFSYLFISPLLWLANGVITGLSEMFLWLLGSRTYCIYGLLDTIVCNSVISPKLTKIYIFATVGVVMAIVWYLTFVFLIRKLDIKTPGREIPIGNDSDNQVYDTSNKSDNSEIDSEIFIEGLGGAGNIIEVNNCFTRLRIDVSDVSKVDKEIINKAKQKGIIIKGNNVQIVIGMTVETVKEELVNLLNSTKRGNL